MTPAVAGGTPRGDPLRIEISARIAERCGLSAVNGQARAQGRLDQTESLQLAFNVDCNSPFRIGVNSAHGAMRLATANPRDSGTDGQGFSIEKGYDVALLVATDNGAIDGGTCHSSALTGRDGRCRFYGARPGQGISSGRDIAIGRTGSLTVSWRGGDDGGPRRAAGNYQDFLTVVIGPRT
ncbi:MAG: hypothetical protein KF780_08930 [Sphingomonas sp.]|nr:hypothetical protein [Sphingomonas sp.]